MPTVSVPVRQGQRDVHGLDEHGLPGDGPVGRLRTVHVPRVHDPWYVTPLTVDRGTPMETVIPAGGGLGTVRQVGLLSLPQSAPA